MQQVVRANLLGGAADTDDVPVTGFSTSLHRQQPEGFTGQVHDGTRWRGGFVAGSHVPVYLGASMFSGVLDCQVGMQLSPKFLSLLRAPQRAGRQPESLAERFQKHASVPQHKCL